MRVLISGGLFYPATVGGPSKTLYWLAKSLVDSGMEVSVITSNKYIEDKTIIFNKWIQFNGIRVRYCKVNNKIGLPVFFHGIREMKKCQTVLLSSLFYYPSFLLCVFAILYKKKIIWSPRGELFDSALNNNKLKLSYIKSIHLLLAKNVIFHATSDEEKKAINRHFGEKCKTVILPNFMEMPKIEKRTEGENYFLFVGRIAPIKALDKLLLGLSMSMDFLSSDYKLLIAGEPEKQFTDYYKTLLDILDSCPQLRSKVVFLGNVADSNKYTLFANAYFTILVSDSENFGNVVIESLCQGTPVIASLGTPWSILGKTNSGLWIENSPKIISEIIDKVLRLKSNDYEQMRTASAKLSMSFDFNTNIHNWISVIN